MATKLSADQVIKQVFDEGTGALKTTPGSATSFSIELSADDGDSSISHRRQLSQKISVTNASPTTLSPEMSVSGLNIINMHAKTTATITGPQVLTLQFSPHATDDIWINTTVTLTPSTTLNNVVSGTQIANLNAVRCRVVCAAAITTGSFDLYIVGN